MNTRSHYDTVIIGAGMSGLAAGIRLAHFGRSVCIFERHNAVGGLNGFYSIDGRKYDVGLHAVTNYVPEGVKGTPLAKIFRQLRIERAEFALCEQKRSRIAFGARGEISLSFTNDFAVFEASVASQFPTQIDGFRALVERLRSYNEVSLSAPVTSAREIVRRHLSDPLLEEMLFCPLMYYGSAQPDDMDFGQFAIMFKALFLEGLARPLEGVRVILRVLVAKYREAGGERRMKCGVRRIIQKNGRAVGVILDTGEEITADHVLSSAGSAETESLLIADTSSDEIGEQKEDRVSAASATFAPSAESPRLSFAETISVFNRLPAALGWGDDTIIFFNDSARFHYRQPDAPVDPHSGVICLPNNFQYPPGQQLAEGILRVTCLANYRQWVDLPEEDYREEKTRTFAELQKSALRFLPDAPDRSLDDVTVATDMFTPRTVEKFTGHREGAIYGAPEKNRNGRTRVENLYLCGTDQGFLGIVGAMLSGISMANLHILAK